MSKRRPITENEKSLWNQATQGIKPMDRDRITVEGQKRPLTRQIIVQRRLSELYQSIGDVPSSAGMSVNDSKLMRSRKIVVEARVDLHGMTKAQAQQHLKKFLLNAQLHGKEWVLVITGKGSSDHKSVLRQEVPHWLDQWSLVTCYMVAKPQDGGSGALYARVRKLKH